MERLSVFEARGDFAETLNRVAYQGARVILHRRGKDVCAIVPLSDLPESAKAKTKTKAPRKR